MKRLYIITGAVGHVASTIMRYLKHQDCLIRGLILPNEQAEDTPQTTYYHGDVSKIETLLPLFENTECNDVVVIHTAGLISIDDKVSPLLYNVNVIGTKNIIELCERYHVSKLVYVSSVHAIPEPADDSTIVETTDFDPAKVVGAYAKTKAEATGLVLAAAKRGLNAVVVHPSGVLGPYDEGGNHLVQLIKMCMKRTLPAGVRGGYDFVDVRDVAKGILLAARHGRSGECYILSNHYFSIAELLEAVRHVIGGHRKLCLPMFLAKACLPLFTWIAKIRKTRPLFTKYALYTLQSKSQFSHAKASRELGYETRPLQTTIRDTIHWLQNKEVPLEAFPELPPLGARPLPRRYRLTRRYRTKVSN